MTIVERLQRLGFHRTSTGGSLQAMVLALDGLEIVATTEADIPVDGQPIHVGWYDSHGNALRIVTMAAPHEGLETLVVNQTGEDC